MKRLTYAIVATIAVLLCIVAWAQRDYARIEIKATHVAGNIYMLEGAGGNIGVSVGPDGILLVDDQYAPLAEKIRNAFGELGDGPLKFLVNTHFHGDHTGGNVVFGNEAYIIAHANVRKRLQMESPPKEALPVVTFVIRCPSTSTVKRFALSTSQIVIRMATASFSSLDQTWCIWEISFFLVDFPTLI